MASHIPRNSSGTRFSVEETLPCYSNIFLKERFKLYYIHTL